MSSKIIVPDSHITDSVFSSATEQEGEFIAQPDADSGNTGSLRPITNGTPADQTGNGTTTGDGAGDNTTTVNSALTIYGDNFWIGATLAITSGAAGGESQTVTDFAQATGTITTAAFTAQIVTGVTYTLTLPHTTRDYKAELVAGGDTGAATFKWSHDGGSTYLGRDNPNQADWLNETEVNAAISTSANYAASIRQMANGNLLAVFRDSGDTYCKCQISSDNGITWGSEITVIAIDAGPVSVVVLQSGRILVYLYISGSDDNLVYSDDNGLTWSGRVGVSAFFTTGQYDVIQLRSGIMKVVGGSTSVYIFSSNDHGFFWTASITVASTTNTQLHPSIVELENGDLFCVYSTDEDSLNDFEIKGKKSTDGGATWGSAIDVLDFGAVDLIDTSAVVDINGDIYVSAISDGSDIVYTVSTDDGATWAAVADLKDTGNNLDSPRLTVINNQEILCAYTDATDGDMDFVRRGMWEAFSGNACPVAINNGKQELCCSVSLQWKGNAGIAADKWTFANGYQYAMENTIDQLGPSKPWRSENDNTDISIVLDAGTNNRFALSDVAFYGCNVRNLSFQTHTSDEWGSPGVDDEVSFDIAQGNAIASNVGNIFQMTLSQLGTETGDEEVTNGGFDSGVTGWSTDGCTIDSVTGGQAGNCLEITRVSGTAQSARGQFSGLSIGTHYRMSAYVKSDTSGDEGFVISLFDAAGSSSVAWLNGTTSTTWTQYDIVFKATEVNHRIFLYKNSSTAGTMLFDTVSMKAISAYDLQDHELKNNYVRFLEGSTEAGNTFKVKDNYDDYVTLDTTAAVTIAANDQFFIYSSKVSHELPASHRPQFMRILITAQQTAEDYYQIGSMIAGIATTLSKGWRAGYSKNVSQNIKIQRTIAGVPIASKFNESKNLFSIQWTASETERNEIMAIENKMSGGNFALIPDSDSLSDTYLVKHIGKTITQTNVVKEKFNIGPIQLEEIV